MYYLAVDIGGTTFRSGAFDQKLQCIGKSKIEYISDYKTRERIIAAIISQVRLLYSKLRINKEDILGVGISCPGPLDIASGTILETPNLKELANFHIKNEFNQLLGIPIYINNDANLFSLGEWYSSFNDINTLVGITLGTGLGFGVILNKELYLGSHQMAAEYGISPNLNGGTWEDLVSIRYIHSLSKEMTNKIISPAELFSMAEEKDSVALEIWDKFGYNLGVVISQVINMLDPQVVTIGGGISHAYKYFYNSCEYQVSKHCPAFQKFKIKIVESKHKEESSLLGAALMVKNKFNKELM